MSTGVGVPPDRRRDTVTIWLPCALVALVSVGVAASGLRGADYPAHLLRALLWERAGLSVWNTYWYGGHPTPTYSLLAPPVSAVVGPVVVAGVSSVVATFAFARLMTALLPGRSTWLANLAFAVGAAVNVVVGRTPYAMGLALCLLALLAWHRRRPATALVLAVLTPLGSPVAAVFLAIAASAVVVDRARRRPAPGLVMALAMTAATAVPVLVMAAAFRSPGWFPFRGDQLLFSVAAATFLFVVHRHPVVRIAAVLTILISIGVFLVPNPLGGNFPRLTQLVAPPLVIVALPGLRRSVTRPLSWLAALALVWSVQPGVVAALEWAGDDSVDADYHAPLIDEIRQRNADGRPLGRVEIPFTENHWEAFFVAPEVPYARGWERQVDLERNGILYDEDLSLAEYHGWLQERAVRWIAVPDVALDEGGRPEAALVARDGTANDIPWLQPVWEHENWRLYEVLDYQPIVDRPAQLVLQEVDRFVVRTDEPAVVTIRFEHSDDLVVDGPACIEADPETGSIIAHLTERGAYEFRFGAEQALPGAASDACTVPTSDPTASPTRTEVMLRPVLRAESSPYG